MASMRMGSGVELDCKTPLQSISTEIDQQRVLQLISIEIDW